MMASIADWCADHVALSWAMGVVLGVIAYLGIGVGLGLAFCNWLEKSADYDPENEGHVSAMGYLFLVLIFFWPVGMMAYPVYRKAVSYFQNESGEQEPDA